MLVHVPSKMGRLGTLLKSTVMDAAFFAAWHLTFWVDPRKSKRTDCGISELERKERDSADLLRAEVTGT